jgi:pimeloyl-ACP methyl ester carboxylesterase
MREVAIPPLGLPAILDVPRSARGLVIFAHGSGSSRHSHRNRDVAAALRDEGFATLRLDLLLSAESGDRAKVFDVPLLAGRLAQASDWAHAEPDLAVLHQGFFGASTGAAAALLAAAGPARRVCAVVSRGGRVDLAGDEVLDQVKAPVLLLVGELDTPVLPLNEEALARLPQPKSLVTVAGAGHLFEEPGAMDRVIAETTAWFTRHISA